MTRQRRTPQIAQHPKDVSVLEGDAFELAVEAEGQPPLSYQWLRAGVLLGQHTQPRLWAQAAALTDAATYACQVL